MKLKELLNNLEVASFHGDDQIDITGIAVDTRKMKTGDLFICIDGIDEDGHQYIKKAKENGAICVLITKDVEHTFENVIKVKDGREALASISDAFFNHPTQSMNLVGITGTKGKTTIAKMLKTILDCDHKKASLSGTLGMFIGDEYIKTKNTTPGALDLQQFFKKSLDQDIHYSVMEVASIALKQKRVSHIDFNIGIFTNLAKTHIGNREHSDFDDYRDSKAKLFTMCKTGLFNIDDSHYKEMTKNATCDVITFSTKNEQADIYVKNIKSEGTSTSFTYIGLDKELALTINLPGLFNVSNAVAAISAAILLGVSDKAIKKGLFESKVKGRCEVLSTDTPYRIMIDFAHNQSSLYKLLTEIKKGVTGNVVLVFGCGGDRDNDMRYEMGEIAGNHADFSIITSDNPRTEDPQTIIDMIEKGMKQTFGEYVCVVNRTDAIKYAMTIAKKDDLVILAGKGHETYIEKNNVRTHYDEREVVEQLLEGVINK